VNRIWVVACAAALAASCGDELDSGAACPALCPEQSLPLQEQVIDAVAFDTTVGAFPIRGTESGLLLAARGDSLDVRGVVRWDSIPSTYLKNGENVPVTAVDSARIFVRVDTSVVHFEGTATIELYDVDTTAADTVQEALTALFRPDRLLGSIDVTREYFFLDDTLSIAIPNEVLLNRITGARRLRVGFRFVGPGDITIHSVETGLPPVLLFDPAPGDTEVASRVVGVLSLTPASDLVVANDLRDFSVVVSGAPPPAERLSAGGLPAFRSYLRFTIPKFFLDSVIIVRAQLLIHQRPVAGIEDDELATVYPVVVSAGNAVTDLRRAAQMVFPPFSYGIEPLVFAPSDSGERQVEFVQLMRQWAIESRLSNPSQTAIVLRGANEGRALGRVAFFGTDAPPGLRPRLRLTYVARTRFGLP
jgi:hypothetical protein